MSASMIKKTSGAWRRHVVISRQIEVLLASAVFGISAEAESQKRLLVDIRSRLSSAGAADNHGVAELGSWYYRALGEANSGYSEFRS
jgi:hypothetical protein